MSTKVLSKTYIRSYHTCICIKGNVGFSCSKPALTLWLSCSTTVGNSFEKGAHESTNHHINTLLWIHPRLTTRRPSIALTLILSILEYPLQVVYVPRKHPRSP